MPRRRSPSPSPTRARALLPPRKQDSGQTLPEGACPRAARHVLPLCPLPCCSMVCLSRSAGRRSCSAGPCPLASVRKGRFWAPVRSQHAAQPLGQRPQAAGSKLHSPQGQVSRTLRAAPALLELASLSPGGHFYCSLSTPHVQKLRVKPSKIPRFLFAKKYTLGPFFASLLICEHLGTPWSHCQAVFAFLFSSECRSSRASTSLLNLGPEEDVQDSESSSYCVTTKIKSVLD